MSDEVQFTIDGDDGAPAKRRTTDADAHDRAETEKTRRALTDAAAAKNELLDARRQNAASNLNRIQAEAERARQAYQHAYDNGDSAKLAQAQQEIASLEAQRQNANAVALQLGRMQPAPTDPVEAFAAGRSPQAQQWLRDHPDYVLNERKLAKLNAAHHDAIAHGIAPDTEEYFSRVNRYVGLEDGGAARRSSGGDGKLTVRVTADPNKVGPNEVQMTSGEYKAATETLTWTHGPNKNQPIGVAEYLRRKGIMRKEGRYNQLESY